LPRRAGVVAEEEAAVFGFDLRVEAARVGARDGEADLAENPFRQPGVARDLGPVVAAVARLEDAAAGAAARHLPRVAVRLPQRRVDDLRVVGIENQLDRAGLVVAEQDLLPRLAAVLRPEDAALRIRRRV